MKKSFFFPFFILGLVSIIAQVLCLRELIVTFYGNELFLGLALGCWLLWTALGSFLGRKLISQKAFLSNLVCLAFILPVSLILIRFLKTFFPPGVLIDFLKAIGLTFILLGPIGCSLGFFFTTAFSIFETKKLAQLVSHAYLIETLGLAIGGLLLNFWLIKHSPLLLILCLSLFSLTLAFFFLKKKILIVFPLLILFLTLYKFPLLEQKTTVLQFPGLVETKNSIYGRITVTKQANQYNFFESGTLTGISQKTEDTEYLIHPILLEHPNPQKILMIGGGLDGGLGEILKYQPEKVTYVELDPVLVETVKEYLQPELAKVLEDKRINLVLTDPRKFLKESEEEYDVVIINLPPPSTALINRLYTQEAMVEIKKILAVNGILAINLSLPTDYLSQEAENLSRCLYQTIKQEFDRIVILPEYTLLFLASSQAALTDDADLLAQRLKTRKIKTDFISSGYLQHRLSDDRIAMFTKVLEKGGPVNSDFSPIAYFFQTTFWQSYFSFQIAKFFTRLPLLGIPCLILLFGGFLIFLVYRRQSLPTFILALNGGIIMVWEIIVIFAFQVKLGYIYQKISLLLAIILTGMALGNYLASRHLKFPKHFRIILLLFLLNSCCLPSILSKANQQLTFFIMAAIAGILTGTIFPLITQGYLKKQSQVGIFYASDLVGAFFGAILVSLFLIPVFGLHTTSYLLVIPLVAIFLLIC